MWRIFITILLIVLSIIAIISIIGFCVSMFLNYKERVDGNG